MKYIIVLGDGMADEPLENYGGKTPLQMANIPEIDRLAKLGRTGRLQTVPAGSTREVRLPTCRCLVTMCLKYLKDVVPWKRRAWV